MYILNICNFVKFDPWHLTHNMEKALWRAEKLKSCGKMIGIMHNFVYVTEVSSCLIVFYQSCGTAQL